MGYILIFFKKSSLHLVLLITYKREFIHPALIIPAAWDCTRQTSSEDPLSLSKLQCSLRKFCSSGTWGWRTVLISFWDSNRKINLFYVKGQVKGLTDFQRSDCQLCVNTDNLTSLNFV